MAPLDVQAGAAALNAPQPAPNSMPGSLLAPPTTASPTNAAQPFTPSTPPVSGGAPLGAQLLGKGGDSGAFALSAMGRKNPPEPRIDQNIMKQADAVSASDPGATAAPGGWARSLVGGAQRALAGIQENLSDFKGTNSPLAGLGQTMANRGQRQVAQQEQLSKQDTDKALKAETVARTVRLYYDMKNSDQEMKNKLAASDASTISANEADFKTDKNLSQSQIDAFEKENPQWFDNYKIAITGWKPSVDADGKPIIDPKSESQKYEPVYSRQSLKPNDGVTTEYTMTKDQAEAATRAGHPVTEGQKVPIAQFNAWWPKVQQFNLAQDQARDANGKELDEENRNEVRGLIQDSHVASAVTAGAMPLVGVNQMLDNIGKAVPQLQTQLDQLKAKNPNDPQIAQLQKNIQDKTDLETKLLRYKEIGVTDKQHEDYVKYQEKEQADAETAKQRAETERHNRADEEIKQHEAALKEADAKGDIGGAATLLRSFNQDPSQLSKRSKSYQATINEADRQEMEEFGRHFDVAQASTDFKYANQKSTQDTMNMINGITERNGSLDIAVQQAKQLPRVNEATINKIFTLGQEEFQDPRLSNFHTSMLGLADEYSKVMGGGQGTDASRQQALDLLKAGYTKGQVDQAAAIIRRDIAARQRALIMTGHHVNRYMVNQYGMPQPTGYTHSAVVPGVNGQPGVTIYAYPDGKIMDAEGNQYDNNGKKL